MNNNNETNIQELNDLILSGKAIEGFDKFYADEVVMQENSAAATIGKAANRKRELDFFGLITEFREAQVLSVGCSRDKTYVEWSFDYTHKDWGVRKYTQVAVQTWKDGKIVHERFYYGN